MTRGQGPWKVLFKQRRKSTRGGENRNNYKNKEEVYLSYSHCKKTNHSQPKCYQRSLMLTVKNFTTLTTLSRFTNHIKQHEEAKTITEQYKKGHLFIATCLTTRNTMGHSWLINNGCTNHMTNIKSYSWNLIKFIVKVKGEYAHLVCQLSYPRQGKENHGYRKYIRFTLMMFMCV